MQLKVREGVWILFNAHLIKSHPHLAKSIASKKKACYYVNRSQMLPLNVI